MKNFEDFIKQNVTNENVTNMIQQADQNIDSLKGNDSELGDLVGAMSYSIALQMLRSYHDWLHQD